jgi:exodeoxyribonuclease VII large subunit
LPEKINDINVFSLLEVTKDIKKTITDRYKNSVWIKAEMNKLNHYPLSGHCYPELVEKQNGKVVAKINANLWKDEYRRINKKFIQTLNEPLKDNITILINATISFEPLYGLALKINDIDPSYTLGELEREKLETIKKLKEEGIYDKNKKLSLPVLPKRIAVISVSTSNGYSDFLEVIRSKKGIYEFHIELFSSLLQGDKAVQSILNQLLKIESKRDNFDLVAIIRGGGGDIGLSCYNNYLLSKKIALFPLPVLTGIGHSTNETVVELVANQNSITPTKLAESLIEKFHSFSLKVLESERIIIEYSKNIFDKEKDKIKQTVRLFNSVSSNGLLKSKNIIKNLSEKLIRTSKSSIDEYRKMNIEKEESLKEMFTDLFINEKFNLTEFGKIIKHRVTYNLIKAKKDYEQILIKIENNCKNNIAKSTSDVKDLKDRISRHLPNLLESKNKDIENINKNIELLNPKNVLKRGYSITYLNRKAIKSYSEVKTDTEVDTVLFEGSFKSKITKIIKDQ